MSLNFKNITAVILAAGKGTRMGLKNINKVTCEVGGKSIILRTIETLQDSGITQIVVVVGHAKRSVLTLLDKKIKTVEQRKRLGTGHAVKTALKIIPKQTEAVLVLNGDDSFFYTSEILKNLLIKFFITKPAVCFLTTEVLNPTGLGRIKRDPQNNVLGIIEEKNANDEEKNTREINPACYLFNKNFLFKYINKIPKNPLKGEYYLTDLISLATQNQEKVEAVKILNLKWKGINTPQDLKEAKKLI